jgi:uncharacterized protein
LRTTREQGAAGAGLEALVASDADAAAERVALFDILRGLALFGMILVHFHQDMRLDVTGPEDLIGWGVWMFVEQKAWGTFAFLFGIGFAVLLRRADARGAPVVPLFLRRLAALALLGIVADVGFGFRILFEYAFWGVALLFVRRWSTRALLAAAALAVCAKWAIIELAALQAWWTATPMPAFARTIDVPRVEASYFTLVGARWTLFVARLHTWRAFVPDTNLALFILGLLAVRYRVLEEPRRHVRLIVGWMTVGALSWTIAWSMELFGVPSLPKLPMPAMAGPLLRAFGFVDDQWLCLTYIGAVALLLAYRPQWQWPLRLFGQAGRMALTNYMLQVVVLDVLASGYGFGLKLRPYSYVVAAVALFAVEAAFSRAWLSRYRFGPLEWLWRTVTYLQRQPLGRESGGAAGAAARPFDRLRAGR